MLGIETSLSVGQRADVQKMIDKALYAHDRAVHGEPNRASVESQLCGRVATVQAEPEPVVVTEPVEDAETARPELEMTEEL